MKFHLIIDDYELCSIEQIIEFFEMGKMLSERQFEDWNVLGKPKDKLSDITFRPNNNDKHLISLLMELMKQSNILIQSLKKNI